MAFDPFKKRNIPVMSLGERAAREQGVYPDADTGWNIPFQVFYSDKSRDGFLIANRQRSIAGVPMQFLVYFDARFRGELRYTGDGWNMRDGEPGFVEALGQWIEIYYQ